MKWIVTWVLLLSFVLSGCTSSVTIKSDPPGASVMVDGVYIGETPTTYSDQAIVMSRRRVVLEKRGYHTVTATITRDSEVNVVAAVIGVACFTPALLWGLNYPREVTFRMQPLGSAQAASCPLDWDAPQQPLH
jgi:hypothetical protein